MSKVYTKIEFNPTEDIINPAIRIKGEGEYNFIDFIVGKPILKDTWYEIEVTIKEKE